MTRHTPHHFHIRPFEGSADARACVQLQEATWGPGFNERVPATMIQLTLRIGGYAAGAFDQSGRMVGFVYGIPGLRDGALIHWSDMLAVHPGWRDHGVGLALKLHQREALLERGVARICWTFEPLEARNAHLNLAKLGGTAREYIRDFYGDSDSVLHEGIGTDRLVVDWDIAEVRVRRRLAGHAGRAHARTPGPIAYAGPGTEPCLDLDEPVVHIAAPADIQALKRENPAQAQSWRAGTRSAFEAYLGRGYIVEDFARDVRGGYYVLRRS